MSGLPTELVKSNETLKLKFTTDEDKSAVAELMVCDGDEKVCRKIKLKKITATGDSVEIGSGKKVAPVDH